MISLKPFTPSLADTADDDMLADAIEADGRALLADGVVVSLERYLNAVPGLERRLVPLDAALDIALRSTARARGMPRPDATDANRLAAAYPSLQGAINDAVSLDAGMLTTSQIRVGSRPEPFAGLPRDFGPLLSDGRERYTLNRLIGAGASGTVYAAIDRHLSEPDRPAEVAIKILSSRRLDRWITRRLTEEATKARRVDHPAVVRVLDRGGELTEAPFIVYELVKGGDLQSWFEAQTKKIPVRRAVEIVAQIARGVQAAHSAGLVHSDLKPANVLLDENLRAKVADFGIAARLHRSLMEDATPTDGDSPVGPVGNMAFISPEQFRAEPGCFSAPADVYALGGILYYLVTGGFPNGDSPADVARNHGDPHRSAGVTPPSLQRLRADVDKSLEMICCKALAAQPASRHASASELADDLEAWLDHRPIRWQRPPASRMLSLWIRRHPSVAALCALAAVLFAAGVISTVHYVGVINDRNEKLTNQNKANAQAIEMLKDLERFIDATRPDDPRGKAIIERSKAALPDVKRGIQPLEETSPPPPEDPAESSPPKRP